MQSAAARVPVTNGDAVEDANQFRATNSTNMALAKRIKYLFGGNFQVPVKVLLRVMITIGIKHTTTITFCLNGFNKV